MNIEDHTYLLNCTVNNTKYYTLAGDEYVCKCIKVYDGDTITVAFIPNGLNNVYKYNIRLSGIDAPEIKSKNIDDKTKAISSRDFLDEKINNKILKIKCGKFDKYGRLLADVYLYGETVSINDLLIQNGYGYAYNGGTKHVI
jgi:endonuclease YncB( thermonuclease family)